MSYLLSIQEFVQQLVDAIAAVIDFDVAIIDDNLSLVAGSGKYKNNIGYNYGKGSITQKLLVANAFSSQEVVLVQTPHYEEICQDCEVREDCDVGSALVCAISFQSNVVGTFSLFATNEKQKNALVRKKKRLSDYLRKMSILISSKIAENDLNNHTHLLDTKFNMVIDSIREGVVVFDADWKITQCNKSAPKMLQKYLGELLGQTIFEIFPNLTKDLILMGNNLTNVELFPGKKVKGQKAAFIGEIIHYDLANRNSGGVISFWSYGKEKTAHFSTSQAQFTFEEIKGSSKIVSDLKERMTRVASTDSTILLYGESGTGKEVFAQAIHSESHRRNGPFIPINCGAIPESLLESELFGYEEGAFSGAKRGGKLGKFELAHGGTIFLDEIGDMPLHLQVKLLRVLQERKFERVGGIEPIWSDIRLVAATNRNLEEMIKIGNFREDLFYRLSVIPFSIPPLRDRENDVLLLAKYFLEKFNTFLRKNIKAFEHSAEDIMLRYSWPGNVRELENSIEYAINIETEHYITANSFPPRIINALPPLFSNHEQVIAEGSLDNLERKAIIEALQHFGTSTSGKEKAAQALGISRATLYRRIKAFDIRK